MDVKKIEYGSDEHLTLIGAAQNLHALTGQDRADMLAFGRACMEAAHEHCAKLCDVKYEIRARDGFPREASTARSLGKALRAEWRKPGGLLDGSFI